MHNQMISIIVPVYNVDKYLSKCINSLINQSYDNIEIILINDGSTDKSSIVCNEYLKKDSRIRVIHKENEGVSIARKVGIEASLGDYIMFVDGDDWIDTEMCNHLIRKSLENNYDVVMCSYTREFNDKSLPKVIFESDLSFDENECVNLYRRLFGLIEDELQSPENMDALCPVCMKLYSAELLKNSEIMYEDLNNIGTYEDGIFNISVFKNVRSAFYINKPLYHYRKTNSESTTQSYKENLFKQWSYLFILMHDYIHENKLSDKFEEALTNRVALSILWLALNINNSDKKALWKIRKIKEILKKYKLQGIYDEFSIKDLKIQWKVYYVFAKYNFASGVYLLTCIIERMIGRK